MAKLPLVTGAYKAKSVLASAQRSVNLYMEPNPKDSAYPFMLYPMPGLTQVASVTPNAGAGWRCLYWATNWQLYGVCGDTFYKINQDWSVKVLGTLASSVGYVHMVDNGNDIIAIDGTSNGYQIDLGSDEFTLLSGGSFYGGNYIDYVDGFFILNRPDTNQWYVSLANQTTFDATDFATKNGFPDKIAGVGVSKRYLYLFGELTTEVWFNSGGTTFAFERLPGVFMQYGCMTPNTIAQMDGDFYWLARSAQGERIICRTSQFQAMKISTFAIDAELSEYDQVEDAFAYTCLLQGHFFYVITFPSADKTWAFDTASGEWTEWLSIDSNGVFHRHPSNCYALGYGNNVVGDYASGKLYLLDPDNYTNNGDPISYVRGFCHNVDDDSNRIMYREFIADMEVGNGDGQSSVPVYLRWSDTRGKSWGNRIEGTLGLEGEYLTSIQFQRLGMARDRVFELGWSAPVKTALAGAWVQAKAANQ